MRSYCSRVSDNCLLLLRIHFCLEKISLELVKIILILLKMVKFVCLCALAASALAVSGRDALLCLADIGNASLCPVHSGFLDITKIGLALIGTVRDEIVDQIIGKLKIFRNIIDRLHLHDRERLSDILLDAGK